VPADWTGERPLYEVKANLFKGLAHPLRIRVLEVLVESAALADDTGSHETPVTTLLERTGLEPSHLSQHLAVLRRNHLVQAERRGSQVFYRLAYAQVSDLLATARALLTEILVTNNEQLARASAAPVRRP
jgi:DNA-binding transcriptional ArsR family regulator